MPTEPGSGRARLLWFVGLWAGSAAVALTAVYGLRGLIGLLTG